MPRSFLIKKRVTFKNNSLTKRRSWENGDSEVVINLPSLLYPYSDNPVPFDLTKRPKHPDLKSECRPHLLNMSLQTERTPAISSVSFPETIINRPKESFCYRTVGSSCLPFGCHARHPDTNSFEYIEQPQMPMSPPRSPPISSDDFVRSSDKPNSGLTDSDREHVFLLKPSSSSQVLVTGKNESPTAWIPYVHQESLLSAPPSPESEVESSRDSTTNIITTIVNKNHLENSRYQCSECNKSYSTHSGLSKHRQFHCDAADKKSFSCKHCDKVYVSLGALKMHIRTHTLPCKCTLCGKAFSRPWLLQGHIRTHTGEKPFSCPHCNRAFADRSNLRAHLQTHSDVKKYRCKSCNKTFSRMSLLVKHEEGVCADGLHYR
ncbi:protein snail homolog Sna-like [Limulus polyphemus]|uniref:Protein snail homolog Sna-like n=1 Tax=Limulus polyphemus TaxID=6850 RepID=A0ABM1BKW1_LIMPO|nr:protein snail homolog Sna-like [Limulus polyphemus]